MPSYNLKYLPPIGFPEFVVAKVKDVPDPLDAAITGPMKELVSVKELPDEYVVIN